ncbi:MAG: hypothetical protein CMN28_02445 [Salinisphaeraceae bacterium]|jgi:hypothetical protein|nr:hypothetical protein [Salinisphaeraceae bacterium]
MRIRTQLESGCPAVDFLADRGEEVIYRWRPGVRTCDVDGRQIKQLFQLLALASTEADLTDDGPPTTRR